MKKKSLFLVIVLLILSNMYSQPLIHYYNNGRIDIKYDLNPELMLSDISLFTQNTKKIDSLIAIGLSGEQLKSVYTYDGDKVVKAEKGYSVDGDWKLDDRVLLTYNEQGQILESKMQSLQYDSVWIDYLRQSYEYNEANKLTSYVIQWYTDGNWQNANRTLFSYSNNDREELFQYFDLGEWIDRTLIHNYISDNGNLDSTFVYQRGDTTWNNYLRWYRHYNEFNKWDYVVAQQWFNSSWTFQTSMEGIYDSFGNLLQVNYFDWSNQFEELKSRLLYSYNTEGNLIEVFNEFKTVDGWLPAQIDPIIISVTEDYAEGFLFNKVSLFYSPISSVKDDGAYTDFTLSQNYPNPFNPSTTLNSQFSILNS